MSKTKLTLVITATTIAASTNLYLDTVVSARRRGTRTTTTGLKPVNIDAKCDLCTHMSHGEHFALEGDTVEVGNGFLGLFR